MSLVMVWLLIVLTNSCVQALQLGCVRGLPNFADQGDHSPALLVGIQALVPAYQFSCYGKVTKWGIATERKGKHSINLQVWRPTIRYGSDVYLLVGTNNFDIEPPMEQKLFYITPPAISQIAVQPGDIIGFHLENNVSIDDNFSIQYKSYTNNVTVHYVMTEEPLTVIEETTLSIRLSKTAPVITVDIDSFLPSTAKLPVTTVPFSSPISLHRSNNISTSVNYKYTSIGSTPSLPTEGPTTRTLPTAVILGVALGILIIAVMLAVLGVVIICKKSGSSKTSEERLCETHTTHKRNRQAQTGTHNMEETSITEFLIKENPAYSQGIDLQISSNNDQAHEYETPVVFKTVKTPQMTANHEYDIPRQVHAYKHHDYEEVLG